MRFAEAAAVPLGGWNALHFMRLANIRPNEQVLVNGAGGSIGLHAVQIARSMGGEVPAPTAPARKAWCGEGERITSSTIGSRISPAAAAAAM